MAPAWPMFKCTSKFTLKNNTSVRQEHQNNIFAIRTYILPSGEFKQYTSLKTH